MSKETPEKTIKDFGKGASEAMSQGREQIKTLRLEPEEVGKVMEMSDDEVVEFVRGKGCDFERQYVNVRTARGTSEAYMRSPAELRGYLKRNETN